VTLDPHVRPLLQPVRLRVVCRHLGQLALVLAVLVAVPAAVAGASGDWQLVLRSLLGAVLPALLVGACARIPAIESPLRANEALVVVALAFVLAAALMTYPLTTAGLSPLDAWFEAVSGVTTTGLTMISDPALSSPAFLFARSWTQWFGGLGIVVLSLALAYGRAADTRRLANAAGEEEDLAQGTRIHARRVLAVYALLTAVGLGLVWMAGMPLFPALIHTLSAISTGGFSGLADSLAGVGRPAQFALLAVAFLGALPLPLFYRAYAHGSSQLWHDPELRALAAAVVLVALLLWCLGSLGPADALLQALTAQTGTGFSTVDMAALDAQSKWVLILSMVTGAGIGSTAGGVKLLRVVILIRIIQLAILRAQLPRHAVVHPSVGGRSLEAHQIENAMLVLLLFPLVIAASWTPFLAAGYAPLDALFEVVSAIGTVGLSTGITGPALEPGLKLVLTLDMLLGRVEVLAVLVLVYPGTWYRR
jgi:trk system potassium uptake protein